MRLSRLLLLQTERWSRRRSHKIFSLSTASSNWAAWRQQHEVPFTQPLHVFVSCLPGIEHILHSEITALSADLQHQHECSSFLQILPREEPGGVSFRLSFLSQLLACHLYLGSASHIFIRCGPPFVAKDTRALTLHVSKLTFWTRYLRTQPNIHFDIRVSASHSKLLHTKVIAQAVELGIHQALDMDLEGKRLAKEPFNVLHNDHISYDSPSESKNTVRILVRIINDRVQLSVDSSDTPLHKRGYRLETGKAPLREDIAFAMLYHALRAHQLSTLTEQYHLHHPNYKIHVIDPFCGSGTIVLEAAAMIKKLPPGRLRSMPLATFRLVTSNQAWADYVSLSLTQSRHSLHDIHSQPYLVAMGSDRDRGVIDIAWKNSIRAGLQDFVSFQHCAISDNPYLQLKNIVPTSHNNTHNVLVATNPPFGIRISKTFTPPSSSSSTTHKKNIHPLLPLYQTMGKLVSSMNYDACVLAHDVGLARRTAIPHLKVAFTTKHGGLSVSALSTVEHCIPQKNIP